MSTFVRWSPRCLWDRARYALYRKRYPDSAWIPRTAVLVLSELIKPNHVGLEWGSGRSTIWLAKQIKHLTSVEDNPARYDDVAERLLMENLTNVDYRLCRLPTAGNPQDSDYIRVLDALAPASLDIVLVKGNHRHLCVNRVLDRVRPGGVLILDSPNLYLPSNSAAPGSISRDGGIPASDWCEFQSRVFDWRYFWATNGVVDTAIWIRP